MADSDEGSAAERGEVLRPVPGELYVMQPNQCFANFDVIIDVIALAVLQPGQCC